MRLRVIIRNSFGRFDLFYDGFTFNVQDLDTNDCDMSFVDFETALKHLIERKGHK